MCGLENLTISNCLVMYVIAKEKHLTALLRVQNSQSNIETIFLILI
jgi:hypothetical protein